MVIPKSYAAVLKQVATKGPVIAYVDLSRLRNYKKGVVLTQCSSSKPNAAVVIVGYGTVKGVKVWIVKNHWGTGWGIRGFYYVRRNLKSVCGIYNYVYAPVV